MEKHKILKLLLFSMILFHSSDASFVKDFRKLIDSTTTTTTKDSPVSEEKKLDPKNTVDEEKKKQENPPSNIAPVSVSPPSQPLPKVENNNGVNQKETTTPNTPPPVPVPVPVPVPATTTPPPPSVPATVPPAPVTATAPPPIPKKAEEDKGKNDKKGKTEEIKFSHSTTSDTCDGLKPTCKDKGDILACISKLDSKYLVVLLHNIGDGTIKVKLQSDFDSSLGDLKVDKNKTEKVTIDRNIMESDELTLSAGKGDCVLHMDTSEEHHPDAPISDASFFLRLPSYDKILTPVNGAYFLILTVLVFGGTWACCMFRKKRHDEVPYQELEMALPESASATHVESAEGWDQVWDDDWDDNVAVKSPVRRAGSISANGLTSRSSNKDGWEDNWDD